MKTEIIEEIENKIFETLSHLIAHRNDELLLSEPGVKLLNALEKIAQETIPAIVEKILGARIEKKIKEGKEERLRAETHKVTQSTPPGRIEPILKTINIRGITIMAAKNEKEFLAKHSRDLLFFRKKKLIQIIRIPSHVVKSITYLKGNYWIAANSESNRGRFSYGKKFKDSIGRVFRFSPTDSKLEMFYESMPGEIFLQLL